MEIYFGIFYHFLAGKRFAEGIEQVNKSVGLPSFFQLNQISPMGGFLRAALHQNGQIGVQSQNLWIGPGFARTTLNSNFAWVFQENGGSKKSFSLVAQKCEITNNKI